jgi:hypothetical protein
MKNGRHRYHRKRAAIANGCRELDRKVAKGFGRHHPQESTKHLSAQPDRFERHLMWHSDAWMDLRLVALLSREMGRVAFLVIAAANAAMLTGSVAQDNFESPLDAIRTDALSAASWLRLVSLRTLD